VEAALVLPVLVVLLFGILEYGLVFRTNLTISQATRSGARVAAAQPRTVGYQTEAAAAVAGALATAGARGDEIGVLVVYRADPATGGLHGGGTSRTAIESCTSNCWRFSWNATDASWVQLPGTSWPAHQQRACGGPDTDFVGVYVRATHHSITGLLPGVQTLSERAVMRLEPLPNSQVCAP
jgi:Flp pilus assembly protein TadG